MADTLTLPFSCGTKYLPSLFVCTVTCWAPLLTDTLTPAKGTFTVPPKCGDSFQIVPVTVPSVPAAGGACPRRSMAAGTGGITWDKAPCRFCGTGCHVRVGVKDGKVVAIEGDQLAEVNKGLLCVKGYHVGLALYGKDLSMGKGQGLMAMADLVSYEAKRRLRERAAN